MHAVAIEKTMVDVDRIRDQLHEMFNLVDEQLADSLNAVLSADSSISDRVAKRDDIIDDLEIKIDRSCEAVIANGPLDRQTIRFTMIAIKINTDLERIGDHSKNLARAGAEYPPLISLLPGEHFDKMVHAVRRMLYAAHDALIKEDRDRAWELVTNDSTVNALHRRTLDLLVERRERGDVAFALGARIFALSKALERIADHCVNIAESVLFWLEGIEVRHGGRNRNDIVTTE